MKTFFSFFSRYIISLLLVIATGVVICLGMVPQQIHSRHEEAAAVPTVEAVPVEPHTSGIDFSVDGEVIPFRRVDIVSEIAGRVIYKSENCRLGCTVQKDEILMRTDPVDYKLEESRAAESFRQAEIGIEENAVQLGNTEKELEIAKQKLELCQIDYERNKGLAAKNTITAADLDGELSKVLSAKETVVKLENQLRIYKTQTDKLNTALKSEQIALDTAKLNLQRTEVKAPITGVITSDAFEVNSFIQRGADIAKILDTSQLEIQCSLYMKQIQWIWKQTSAADDAAVQSAGYVFPPTPVTILYENDGEKWSWDGVLATIDGGVVNSATRMVPCRVKVDNPVGEGQKLKKNIIQLRNPMLFAGMFVNVIVHSKPDVVLYRIPERALLPGNRIWLVVDNKLRSLNVRVAAASKDGVLIYADEFIKPNDLVVVSPLATPIEGGSINVSTVNPH
ncbi:hypothetical protein FACS189419_03430 [Planctomycetales bacterium]|nr:hypothetical protein FACS189419_03430 [Planctomycetales bacterium]